MKNKILFLFLIFGIAAGVSIGLQVTHSQKQFKKQVLSASADVKRQLALISPTVTPGVPISISIPKIGVRAHIESVAMDSLGRMDVPQNPDDTAWYSPGFRPGMKGNAVIDGHLDKVTGAPAVFWNLKELSTGDSIAVTESNGAKYTFTVDRVVKYPYNQFPLQEVFGNSDIPKLNLITCNGVWDKNSKNYSDRLVVYSKIVSEN